MTESSIVRENLMNEEGYSPYCGNESCARRWPRSKWDATKHQFTCVCGWISKFPADFIARYRARWNK